jgi:6-phosphogluconate dehydrogenase
MQIGMIGLGKMGANMVRRLMRGGHECVVFDLNHENVKILADEGATGVSSMEELVKKLHKPRNVWIMVPAGNPTEQTVLNLANMMESDDVIIDGGNSYYKDDIRRSEELRKKKLHYIDVGTSGGVWGMEEGYSIMVGGEEKVVEILRPIFETLAPAPDKGWGYVGPSGAGHFVKMIHNGIEYGLMQAYAEGFELMRHKEEFKLDLRSIAEIWQFGSVVRSWLLDLIERSLREDPTLKDIAAWVPDSGEGRWTLLEAVEQNCAIPVITMSLERRFRSREQAPFSDKLLAAMRQQFGGHAVKKEG